MKSKRRRNRREGTPRYQFVTATDPIEFKGEHAKKTVRSQAMTNYRSRERRQRGSIQASEASSSDRRDTSSPETSSTTSLRGTKALNLAYAELLRPVDEHRPYPAPVWDGQDFSSPYADNAMGYNARPKVLDYEEADFYEDFGTHVLAKGLACDFQTGEYPHGADSSVALPQLRTPGLDATYLIRKCKRLQI